MTHRHTTRRTTDPAASGRGSAARRAAVAGLAALAATTFVLAVPGASTAGAAPRGVVWKVAWKAPVTTAGPNRFAAAPVLAGTASYSLGKVSRVDVTATPAVALPAPCGSFPTASLAELAGGSFTARPQLACNGTYDVAVVAQSGSGSLASRSNPLHAPVTLVDPGPAPTGLTAVAQGDHSTVALSWNRDLDPDVVAYRLRRDGNAIVDVRADGRTFVDRVPSAGTYTYDLVTLRWGEGGPGSAPVTSPATAPLVVKVVEGAAPTTVTSSGTTGTGTGSTGGSSSGGSGPTGSSATGGAHAATSGSSAGHRPGGALPTRKQANARVSSSDSTSTRKAASSGDVTTSTIDDGYADRLPYQSGTARERVELADPAASRTVARSVSVPGRHRPGLIVPLAVVAVLLAGSLQLRALVRRARAADATPQLGGL